MTIAEVALIISLAVSSALADPLCQFKPDGKYPLRDTFKYLVCKEHKGTLFSCPKNQVFIAREDRCRTVTIQDQITFCEGLEDGDYRDPWYCNKFLKCVAGKVYTFSCGSKSLVYNPNSDKCVFIGEFPCTVVKNYRNGISDSSCGSCQGRPDGDYPCRDTFTYLKCKGQTGSTVKCPKNQVYIHRERRCRTVTVADQSTFCEGLPRNDYRDPWNCHKFIKCYDQITYYFDCQPTLVFDPYKDQCVYNYEYPCVTVKSQMMDTNRVESNNFCLYKPDGKYPMSDTFVYLQCKNHVGTIVYCPPNQVYIHRERRCRTVSDVDKQIFCEGLPNGDYRYPWNCHMFFKCFVGKTYPFNCQKPTNELVFNPYKDQCVYLYKYPCKEVKSTSKAPQVTANRCTGRPDGNYVIPDVFSYLECKSGSEILHNCPTNQIFVAHKKACSAVTTADEDIFCEGRSSGNYRNPWNCHHFISCVIGHPSPYDRPCHPLSLVYDPNNDRCEHDTLFPCKNLTSPTPPKNRCTGKPDGLYILSDVFKYLECKGGQEILHFCPYKQIFVPDIMKCRAVIPSDRVTFCNNRPVGNYRNPWNCHHFITCATGHPVYDRPCHPLSLVYDPDNDRCEHDYLMTCVEV